MLVGEAGSEAVYLYGCPCAQNYGERQIVGSKSPREQTHVGFLRIHHTTANVCNWPTETTVTAELSKIGTCCEFRRHFWSKCYRFEVKGRHISYDMNFHPRQCVCHDYVFVCPAPNVWGKLIDIFTLVNLLLKEFRTKGLQFVFSEDDQWPAVYNMLNMANCFRRA